MSTVSEPGGLPSGRNPHVETEHVDVGQAHIEIHDAQITPDAARQARRLAYGLVVIFVVTIALLAASFLFQNSQVSAVRENSNAIAAQNIKLEQQLQADCAADKDLAGLPLSNAPNGHPSELGVKIISDFRASWYKKGCTGSLPPADPTYVAGALYYHLPVNP